MPPAGSMETTQPPQPLATPPAWPEAWRWHGAALAALLGLILLLYRDTAAAMVGIWMRSDNFAHAFVVPPIALWLAWRQRDWLRQVQPRAMPWLALPMAGLALVWWLGHLVATNSITQLMLMALLVCAVPAVLGAQAARVIMFPLGFLFFAVPLGEFLTPLLMQHTADFVVAALRLTGIPVYREGLQFVIPSGHWSVVEACSGIRYLMASLMAGTLFAYLNYRSHARRWAFVGVAIVVPILANWLRAYIIVMLAHVSDNSIATGVDHLVYGWVFFGIVIMLMFYVGGRWSEPDPAPAVPAADVAGSAAGRKFSPGALALASAAVLAAVAVPPVLSLRQAGDVHGPAPRVELPADLAAQWVAAEGRLPNWQPRFVNASTSQQRVYASGDGAVGLYLAYYVHQDQQRKLVSSENMLVHSQDPQWNPVAAGQASAALPQGAVTVRAATITGLPGGLSSRRPRLRVWQLYWVGGRYIASDWHAKLAQAWQVVLGRGDGGAALVLYTVEDSPAAADARLAGFLQTQAADLDRLLRGMRTP
jgi:exosortase A